MEAWVGKSKELECCCDQSRCLPLPPIGWLQWFMDPMADLEYPKSKKPAFPEKNVLASFSWPAQKEQKQELMQ